MKNYLLIILTFSTFQLGAGFSQNLVPNPGFESQDSCPAVSEIFVAQPWDSPTLGTPDAFNSSCPSQNISARTGIGSSGVFIYSTFANSREYIQAPLNSTLSPGQLYCVTFYVKRSNYRYGANRFGAYFSNTAINLTQTSVLNYVPQVQNPASTMLAGNGWMSISGSFIASGGESFILIGNFSNDANTDTVVLNAASSSKVAFYQIDDISVVACSAGLDENEAFDFNFYPNPLVSEELNIKTNGATLSSLSIKDLTGKVVFQKTDFTSATVQTLQLPKMIAGIYVIEVSSGSSFSSKKLIIQ